MASSPHPPNGGSASSLFSHKSSCTVLQKGPGSTCAVPLGSCVRRASRAQSWESALQMGRPFPPPHPPCPQVRLFPHRVGTNPPDVFSTSLRKERSGSKQISTDTERWCVLNCFPHPVSAGVLDVSKQRRSLLPHSQGTTSARPLHAC